MLNPADTTEAACTGKHAFASYTGAARIIDVRRTQTEWRRKMNVYRCRECHRYHIGRTDPEGALTSPRRWRWRTDGWEVMAHGES